MIFRRTLAALAASILFAPMAQARPFYFDNFMDLYGFQDGDDLYACGMCHKRWEGTGPRNPYGTAIEQQLYLGKPILDSIMAVEPLDTDGDGALNVDEITVHGTLPGYSCDNWFDAIDPPAGFQVLIDPNVATCQEPRDIRLDPDAIGFFTELGEADSSPIDVINNGSDDPLNVTVTMVPGSDPGMSVSDAGIPMLIPVGVTWTIQVTFAPQLSGAVAGAVRVTSDDPDEPIIDLPVSAVGFVRPLADADERAACLKDVQRNFSRYSRTHLKEWGRCYTDELAGFACDTGRRDSKVAKAEQKLRDFVGGPKDKRCAAASLSPSFLGLPLFCPAPCESIPLGTFGDYSDCLVCSQEMATSAMLQQSAGVSPPDLPGTVLGGDAHRCNRSLIQAMEKGIGKIQKTLQSCELANILALSPVDCAAEKLDDITKERDRINDKLDRCKATTGMEGCLFESDPNSVPDPECLGNAANEISTDLTTVIFGD